MAERSSVETRGRSKEQLHEDPAMQSAAGEPEKRGSPPPLKAMPMKPKDPSVPFPSSRPPSATSIQSNSSKGAPPRTTTSRRGGRTRSRSPPTMTNRPGSANNSDREFAEVMPSMENRNQSQSPANPSSAAAAAAAAAKAFSSNSGSRNPNQWYEGAPEGSGQREQRPEGARYHPGYDKRYPESRSWPGEEDPEGRRNYRSSRSREGEPEGRHYSQRGPYPADQSRSGSGSQSEGRRGSSRRQYEQYGAECDGRYQESRSRGSFERDGSRGDQSSSYEADRHHQRYGRRREEPEEYCRGPGGMAPVAHDAFSPKTSGPQDEPSTPLTAKRSGGGGRTTRVIGTATPIHVPRATVPPAGTHHPPAGTPASVFRGRPGNEAPGNAPTDDSPQKILLSLRTPSNSFEEAQHSRLRKEGQVAPPLSPEEPPQIQHSHHQHQMDQSLFFEQQPKEAPVQASTLEMAPSFSLFNQSFDSLGDTAQYLNVSGPLDASFNAASFGAGPTASRDIDTVAQLLPNPSGTNSFAAGERFLAGSSSAGMMTFGMSPVNSFGNGPSNNPSRRNGNMMVLGGPDQQSTSPTQMLNMYPSYSGGGYGSQGSQQAAGPFRTRGGQMPEQNVMRTTNSGSFGGSAMYSRSYDASPHGGYHTLPHDGPRPPNGPPGFYAFLGRNKAAFINCSFLLPGLKAALLESPLSDFKAGDDEKTSRKLSLGGRRGRFADPSPQDSAMSTRRVASAICAFGGCIMGDRANNSTQVKNKENKQSIFREKEDGSKAEGVTVTPSSSSGTPPGTAGRQPRMRHKYDELLPSRYYENENRLSWEFEESPPVGGDEESIMGRKGTGDEKDDLEKQDNSDDPSRVLSSPQPNDPDKTGSSPTNDDDDDDDDEDGKKGSSDQPKMRYRCKLCGLPKQNHTCAYQQSLQRSIGIMIYPAVNAFTSSEPGMLAPALTDMNNFVSQQEETSSTETSPSRPTPDRVRRSGQTSSTPGSKPPNVTPETMRSSNLSSSKANSPAGARTPLRSPLSQKRKPRGSNMSGGAAMGQRVGTGSPPGSSNRKRTHGQMSTAAEEDLLFVETTDLKPEQFRIVTPSKKAPGPDAYTYPSLPLPYAQRKRLSDNLFALSKEVPQLTDECAVVLREAREKDMWDLAVAELMTQVVVVIHCHDNDTRFEGLRHYLLTLGIAC